MIDQNIFAFLASATLSPESDIRLCKMNIKIRLILT
jgi:hypothetical protein